jgi:hypothetical protein
VRIRYAIRSPPKVSPGFIILYRRPISKTSRKNAAFSSNLELCTSLLPLRKSVATIIPDSVLKTSLSSWITRFTGDRYDSTSTLSVYSLTLSDASSRLNNARSSSVSRSGTYAASRTSGDSPSTPTAGSISASSSSSSSLPSSSPFSRTPFAPQSSGLEVSTSGWPSTASATSRVGAGVSTAVTAAAEATGSSDDGGGSAAAEGTEGGVSGVTWWARREPARCCAWKQSSQ